MALDPSLLIPNTGLLQSIANPPAPPTPFQQQEAALRLQSARTQAQTAQLELQQQQRALQAQQAQDIAMRNAITIAPDGSTQFNTQGVSKSLSDQGFGHLVPGLVETMNKANQTIVDYNKSKADLAEKQNDLGGFIANGIQQHFTPDSLITGATMLGKQGILDQARVNQIVQDVQTNQNDLAYLHQTYDPILVQLAGNSKGVQTMRGTLLRGQAQMGELERKQKSDAAAALAGATNDAEFQQKLKDLQTAGTPASALSEWSGKTWSPDLQFELMTRDAPAAQRADMAMTYARSHLSSLSAAAQQGGDAWKQAVGRLPKAVQPIFSGLPPQPTTQDVERAVMTPAELIKANAPPAGGESAQYIADYLRRNPGRTVQDAVRQYAIDKQEPQRPPQVIMMVPNQQGGATATVVRPGTTVAPGAVTAAGYNALNLPTSSTRTMIEAAPGVLNLANRIDKEIDQQKASLGPAASRWNEFMTRKVGAPNPEFTKLVTDTDLLTTLLMRMHVGARGGEGMMQHFQNLLATGKQSPENLKAALQEIRQYTQDRISEGASVGAIRSGGGAAPSPSTRPPLTEIFK